MGLRGPLRDPLSRRGVREIGEGWKPEAPESPDPPDWLTKRGREIFAGLVADLVAARVPIKRVDSHAIAMAALCVSEVERWTKHGEEMRGEMMLQCAQVAARNQRDAQQWLQVIGATPKGRAQMGLRGQEQDKKPGAVANILAARQQRSAG
jgi:phage terminase small subunit